MTQSGHCPLSFRLTTLQSLLPSSLVLGFLYFAQSTRVDEAIMSKEIQRIQARARELARSGTFIGWRPIAFELQFEPAMLTVMDLRLPRCQRCRPRSWKSSETY
jgi:hypothetical protein